MHVLLLQGKYSVCCEETRRVGELESSMSMSLNWVHITQSF
jgi:hypothetical protein